MRSFLPVPLLVSTLWLSACASTVETGGGGTITGEYVSIDGTGDPLLTTGCAGFADDGTVVGYVQPTVQIGGIAVSNQLNACAPGYLPELILTISVGAPPYPDTLPVQVQYNDAEGHIWTGKGTIDLPGLCQGTAPITGSYTTGQLQGPIPPPHAPLSGTFRVDQVCIGH